MSKIRELEFVRATIAEYQSVGLHDRARELSQRLPALEKEAEAESRGLRAAVSPLAGLADAAADVAARGQDRPAFVETETTPERTARRAALSPLLAAADELRDRQIKERQRR